MKVYSGVKFAERRVADGFLDRGIMHGHSSLSLCIVNSWGLLKLPLSMVMAQDSLVRFIPLFPKQRI